MAAQLDREQQLAAENQALKAALAASHRQMDSLQQRYQNLSDSYEKIRRLHFGTSSEKLPATGDANQLDLELFNEAEAYSDATVEELEVPGEQESEALAGKPRKKPGRKPIPAHLERIEIPHDVAEAVTLADRVLIIEEGEIAMDLSIDLPRPRERGSPEVAQLEGRILRELFRNFKAGEDA